MLSLSGMSYSGFERVSDVVIENGFEDLELKQKMVADIEQHAKPETIFATIPVRCRLLRLRRKRSVHKM